MAYVLPLLSVLACPLGMGVMMWLIMRSQRAHPQESASTGMTTPHPSRLRLCINWKVVAGLTWAAFVLWLVLPNVFWLALPVLIIAACPLSMLLMMRGMRRQHTSLAQANETPHTAEAQLPTVRAQQEPLGREIARIETTPAVERE